MSTCLGYLDQGSSEHCSSVPGQCQSLALLLRDYQKGWLAQTHSSAMQMVSETGEIFDTFQLTKPVGWTNNVTNQTTFATNFQSTYVPSAAELYGYTGSTAAVAAILAVVAANPSNYTSLQVSCLREAFNQGKQQSGMGFGCHCSCIVRHTAYPAAHA